MSTIRKSITFTEQQDSWIKLQIENGDYTNDSEYIRDLVRKDQTENKSFMQLRTALYEGLNSGVATKTVSEIMKEVEVKMKNEGKL